MATPRPAWETPLQLLFLVGAAYPALAMATVVTLMALYEAGRNRALGVRQVVPAAIAAVWIAMFAVMLFVADIPKTPVFAAASIVAGALICGFVVAGHLGNGVAVALLGSFVLPVLLLGSVSSANSARQAALRLGMLEKRLDEVTGTLEWETQGPSLMAERRAVESEIREIDVRRGQAMTRIAAVAGLLALVAALLTAKRSRLLALGLAGSGVWCLLLSIGFGVTGP